MDLVCTERELNCCLNTDYKNQVLANEEVRFQLQFGFHDQLGDVA